MSPRRVQPANMPPTPTPTPTPTHHLLSPSPQPLSSLPDELLLHILALLDVPELLTTSRTSHRLRTLSLDPLLHSLRLHHASLAISRAIPARPTLHELIAQRIWVSRTTLLARNLSRNLIAIKLNRSLQRRPPAETLVEKGVLPGECVDKQGVRWVSSDVVVLKRRVERERVKDGLRRWIGEWRAKGLEQRREEGRTEVRFLARRFGAGHSAGQKRTPEKRELPARAKVLGLRRFWERIGRDDIPA